MRLGVILILAVGLVLAPLAAGAADPAAITGEKVFKSQCGQCHALPDPEKLTAEQWVLRIEEMAPMAGLKSGEKTEVLGFLQGHSRKVVKIMSMAEEKRLFEQKCGLCHTPDRVFLEPLSGESLRHVVLRMRERAPGWISAEELQEIMEYLSHGAPESKRPEKKPVAGSEALFRDRCSTCHTLERVYLELEEAKGKAPPWLHVVKRMQEKAPQWITPGEAGEIVKYLQTLKAVKPAPAKK